MHTWSAVCRWANVVDWALPSYRVHQFNNILALLVPTCVPTTLHQDRSTTSLTTPVLPHIESLLARMRLQCTAVRHHRYWWRRTSNQQPTSLAHWCLLSESSRQQNPKKRRYTRHRNGWPTNVATHLPMWRNFIFKIEHKNAFFLQFSATIPCYWTLENTFCLLNWHVDIRAYFRCVKISVEITSPTDIKKTV
jgi:hypothetical protein